MMLFVTPKDQDNRFVIYVKTSTCKIKYNKEGLIFESSLIKINIMKDFLLNYGIKDIEVRESSNIGQLLVHDEDVFMQFEDTDNIAGLKVPVLTII